MKKISFIICFMFLFNALDAQVYKTIIPGAEFSETLSKIVLDFRNNFQNIKGKSIPKEVGTDLSESLIKLPGSVDNYISTSHSVKDRTASFQSIMYRGTDYNKAVKIYHNVFKQIKRTRVRWIDKSLSNFIGKIEEPDGLTFTTSYLKVEISDPRYEDFITEVALVNSNFDNWEVQVNIVHKKLDIEIAPDN